MKVLLIAFLLFGLVNLNIAKVPSGYKGPRLSAGSDSIRAKVIASGDVDNSELEREEIDSSKDVEFSRNPVVIINKNLEPEDETRSIEPETTNVDDNTRPWNSFPSFGPPILSFRPLFPTILDFSIPSRRVPQFRPWWQGLNVCKDEKIINDEDEQSNETSTTTEKPRNFFIHFNTLICKEDELSHTCTETKYDGGKEMKKVISYQCCPGYQRKPTGYPRFCEELKNLDDTMKALGSEKMAHSIEKSDINSIRNGTNITIFTPSNDIIANFDSSSSSSNPMGENKEVNEIPIEWTDSVDSQPSKVSSNINLSSYIVSGVHPISGFNNDMILRSIDNESTIIVSNGRNGKYYANCVPMKSINNFYDNGVIHVIDGSLPKSEKNIITILEKDGRFTRFLSMIREAKMDSQLADKNANLTVMAPTDEAFEKLGSDIIERLSDTKSCLMKENRLLNSHIMKGFWCPSMNSSNDNKKDMKPKVFASGNGLVHVLDAVIIPEESKSLFTIRDDLSGSRFNFDYFKYLNETKIEKELEKSQDNLTILIPIEMNDDFVASQWNNDTESMVKSHVIVGDIISRDKPTDLKTLSGGKVNIETMRTLFGSSAIIQCSHIYLASQTQTCSGKVYFISEPLKPLKKTILSIIEDSKSNEIFKRLVTNSSYNEKFSNINQSLTLLMPSDESLKKVLTIDMLDKLENDDNIRERFIGNHVIEGSKCCDNLGGRRRSSNIRVIGSGKIIISNEINNESSRMAEINNCNLPAENGMVHSIDYVNGRPYVPSVPDIMKRFGFRKIDPQSDVMSWF